MTDQDDDKTGKPLSDRDAMDKLPLSIIPLKSTTLKSARLVKTTQLETMVELHSDPKAGSLQIRTLDIPASFPGTSSADQEIITSLADLHSYDVYSLRTNLKRLGIAVDPAALELSEEMEERLERYSQEFTRPLMSSIFGNEKISVTDILNPKKSMGTSGIAAVQQRLTAMSQKLEVPLVAVPVFLQEYRDLFMSTLYFRDNFESLEPDVHRFWPWLAHLQAQREVTDSIAAIASCRRVAGAVKFLLESTRDRLARFRAGFDEFWGDIGQESFSRLNREIQDNQNSMAAVLCGLSIKLRDWSKTFPDADAASPSVRVKYVMTKLEPGLQNLTSLENDARGKIGMKPADHF